MTPQLSAKLARRTVRAGPIPPGRWRWSRSLACSPCIAPGEASWAQLLAVLLMIIGLVLLAGFAGWVD